MRSMIERKRHGAPRTRPFDLGRGVRCDSKLLRVSEPSREPKLAQFSEDGRAECYV
ncbi:MAG: hypothetical protein RJA70_1531 [Pseudomonadota bacterium]